MAVCQLEVCGRLPGSLSDQLWRNLKNTETPAMILIEGKFPLTWFLTTALLSMRETKVSSAYTWREDTAERVYTKIYIALKSMQSLWQHANVIVRPNISNLLANLGTW